MPANGAVLSVLTDVLKNLYLGNVQEQLFNQVLINQILQLDSKHVDLEGLQAVIALHTGRSGGTGSRDEMDDLPDPGYQRYKKAVYDLKYHYGVIQVSGQSLQKTKSNVGAFLRAYESELNGIKDDLALDFARQIYGAGNGVLAQVQSGVTSQTLTLTSAEPLVKGFIYEGRIVDIGTLASPTASASAVEVDDFDESASTIHLTTSVTVLANDYIFVKGSAKANATKEMDSGIQKLIPTAANTVGGIDASAAGNRIWDNLRDTSGGSISLTKLMQNLNKVTRKGVQLDDLVCLTTPGVARLLFESSDFASKVTFPEVTEFKGGFEGISFSAGSGRVKMVTDRLAPWGKVHFIPKSNFRMFTPGDWDFLAKDGQAIKWVQNKDAFKSILFRYANMGTNRRNNSLVMSGLTDPGY